MNIDLRRGTSPTARTLTIGDVTLVFSYATVVAFAVSGQGWTVSENVWGPTTGKHINQETSRGVKRTPRKKFEQQVEELFTRLHWREAA